MAEAAEYVRQAKLRRGHRVTFYRNGDTHFKGLKTSVSKKMFATFETLLAWLNERIHTLGGVRFILSLPDGTEMKDIAEFVGGRFYVVSSVRKLIQVSYGNSKERFLMNQSVNRLTGSQAFDSDEDFPNGTTRATTANELGGQNEESEVGESSERKGGFGQSSDLRQDGESEMGPNDGSGGLGGKNESADFQNDTPDSITSIIGLDQNGFGSPSIGITPGTRGLISDSPRTTPPASDYTPSRMTPRPRILQIISNTDRNSQKKVIFNPQTAQMYEEVLVDIESMVKVEFPPVTCLYTAKKPYTKVLGISHLTRELREEREFLACGREALPLELQVELIKEAPRSKPSTPLEANQGTVSYRGLRIGNVLADDDERYEVVQTTVVQDNQDNQNTTNNQQQIQQKQQQQVKQQQQQQRLHDQQQQKLLVQLQQQQQQLQEQQQQQQLLQQQRQQEQLQQPKQQLEEEKRPHREQQQRRQQQPQQQKQQKQSIRPYRRARPETELLRVYIHGHLREFLAPRSEAALIEIDTGGPEKKLSVNWVYGYRGRDSANNLFTLSPNTHLYYVAAVAVIYNMETNVQKHYTGHTEDITCMAVHPTLAVVATGQLAGKAAKARVRIWDHETMRTVAELESCLFVRGVASVSFSNKTGDAAAGDSREGGVKLGSGRVEGRTEFDDVGKYLLAVDGGPNHTLFVWEWRTKRLIALTSTTISDEVVRGAFHPLDQTVIITYGRQQVHFWRIFLDGRGSRAKGDGAGGSEVQGRILRDKLSGSLTLDILPGLTTSLTFSLSGDVITGDSTGRVTVWSDKNVTRTFVVNKTATDNLSRAHEKPVSALCMLEDGSLLTAGSREIKAWNSFDDYKLVRKQTLSKSSGYVRTLASDIGGGVDGQIYVGTTNNVILCGSLQSNFTSILQGHSEELWAIASHPVDQVFVTAGYDECVTLWNALTHKTLWRVNVEKPCVSVDFNLTGQFLVVGTTVGRFIALETSTGSHVVSVQVGTESLDTVKFSPDGRFLAAGSQDTFIHVYETLDNCQVFKRYQAGLLQGHENFVSHVDWSRDGKFLRSVSGDYDLLFWNMSSLQAVNAEEVCDIMWSSQDCILGYEVIGPWSNLKDTEDINTMARSTSSQFLAVGNNKGTLSLYKYPSTAERPLGDVHKICTGHVTKTCFTADDRFVITSGGVDAGVMQWELV